MALVRIRYKGLSDVRAITAQDLAQFGIQTDQDLVWDSVGRLAGGDVPGINRPDRPNAARGIVVEGLSDDLLEALSKEGTFTITEINDDNTDGDDIVTGQALDDTGSRVVLGETGQVSEKGESNPNADPVVGGDEQKAAPKAEEVPSGTLSGGSTDASGTTTPTGKAGKGSSTAGGGTAGNGSST